MEIIILPSVPQFVIGIVELFISTLTEKQHVQEITNQDIRNFRESQLEDYRKSKKTVDLQLIAIRNFFNYAVEKHKLADNPAAGISVKRTKAESNREKRSVKRRPPTHNEADKICLEFPGYHKVFSNQDFQDYAMFARYTGMRQGEIARIRKVDFNLYPEDAYIDTILASPKTHSEPYESHIPNDRVLCILVADTEAGFTKTGFERIIPVAQKLLPVVDRRVRNNSSKFIFPFASKDSGASFGRLWLKKVKKLGSDLTMHGFRHYAGSEMNNKRVDRESSKAILGHEANETHDIYIHQKVGKLKEAIEKIY